MPASWWVYPLVWFRRLSLSMWPFVQDKWFAHGWTRDKKQCLLVDDAQFGGSSLPDIEVSPCQAAQGRYTQHHPVTVCIVFFEHCPWFFMLLRHTIQRYVDVADVGLLKNCVWLCNQISYLIQCRLIRSLMNLIYLRCQLFELVWLTFIGFWRKQVFRKAIYMYIYLYIYIKANAIWLYGLIVICVWLKKKDIKAVSCNNHDRIRFPFE